MPEKILLLSAYDAQSHRQWRHALENMFAEYDWVQLALPARYFSWRVRGNSLSWGFNEQEVLSQDYQALIVTSMVDLASLRGFVPSLAQIPTLVYFHENQFVYPANHLQDSASLTTLLDAQLVSLYSALCADEVVFNSEFNKRTWLHGVCGILKKFPDHVPAGIIDRFTRAEVLPVPLSPELFQRAQTEKDQTFNTDRLKIAWNHRWEYDKGPEQLLQIVEKVVQQQLPVQFFIFGEQFRQRPEAFEKLEEILKTHSTLNHMGYVENRQDYFTMLRQCDVVLSTALHDFQGLAVLEAAALGCTPLAPNDLVYPEYLDDEFMYGRDSTVEQIVERFVRWGKLKAADVVLPKVDVARFDPALLKKGYLALLTRLFDKRG